MIRRRRWLFYPLGGLLVVVLLVAGASWALLAASLPRTGGELALAGLEAPVSIERDARGVVTVRGQSRRDLARATGFVHAQERFFSMDLMRRDAAGELAALFGPLAVEHDRRRRLHGLRAVARQALALQTAEHQGWLQAYAEGVNAGLADLTAAPFEYLLLRQQPRPWAAEDTLLVVHAMWFTLTDERAERDRDVSRLARTLPEALVTWLAAPGSALDADLDGEPLVLPPLPAADELDLRQLAAVDLPPAPLAGEAVPGSNAWVVGGAHTCHGAALLANDMHLTLRVPNIWFRLRLVLDDGWQRLDVAGVSLPGTPAVVGGSNGMVAWGFTNAYADVTDRVRLQPVAGDADRYQTADGPRRFAKRVESIEVAGGDSVQARFRDSLWGPVVEEDGELHAVRWAAHAPSATGVGLMRIEAARDVDDALERVRDAGMPAQNLMLADAAGRIAWTIVGPLPRRRAGVDHGRVIDWREAGDGRWQWLAADRVPTRRRGPGGVLWSANARMVSGADLALLGNGGYALASRARQIRDRLHALRGADERALLDIALDDRALLLERWRELLADVLRDGRVDAPLAAELEAVLATWSGHAQPDDAAYRWVREFRDAVHAEVLAGLLQGSELAGRRLSGLRQVEGLIWQLLHTRPPHLLASRYPDWDALLVEALQRAVQRVREQRPGPLAERTWGERNTVVIAHPLSRAVPALGRLLDMPAVALPGDAHVPRLQRGTMGASERLVVAPGQEGAALFHMPGGQSGHPLSPHYDDGHADWVHGRPTPYLPGPTRQVLRLRPDD